MVEVWVCDDVERRDSDATKYEFGISVKKNVKLLGKIYSGRGE